MPPEQIVRALHCRSCAEGERDEHLEVGLTARAGLLVRCQTCGRTILHIEEPEEAAHVFKHIVGQPCDGCGEGLTT